MADDYHYPFAASPDIIRSYQKDAYFQGVLYEQLSSVIRTLYGARFAHTHTSEARTFAELLYLGLTTFVGNRTLGEEYCDIIQVEDDSLQLPSLRRRAGYIFSTILLPYALTRALPAFRSRVRAKLEANLARAAKKAASNKKSGNHPLPVSRAVSLQSYILHNLDTLTSPSPIYAASLATFYFTGSYYHIGKRLWGLRYIFTRQLEPSEERIGYEVLGVLLVLQLSVQAYLHFSQTFQSTAAAALGISSNNTAMSTSAALDHGVEVSLNPADYSPNNALLFSEDPYSNSSSGSSLTRESLQRTIHTPALGQPRYDLRTPETMGWMHGRQMRKCTLCLEEMKDPSVTTCGHVFCWMCIGDWCREKPECPLCRQMCLVQHILPLRG